MIKAICSRIGLQPRINLKHQRQSVNEPYFCERTFDFLEEEFPVHLEVRLLEDVPDQSPAEAGVRVQNNLSRNAIGDNEHHEDDHKEGQVHHLQTETRENQHHEDDHKECQVHHLQTETGENEHYEDDHKECQVHHLQTETRENQHHEDDHKECQVHHLQTETPDNEHYEDDPTIYIT